ncbi:MAG: hypothetical protein HQL32_00070 [Planctomycetes bacterium]|nr:hypothetical protein [Planctomycetota bacterium]
MAKGRRIEYRSFESAREFARALCLRNKDEWTRYAKGELEDKEAKPKDIPSRVDKIYKGKGWCGFDDFLGTSKVKELRKNYRSFEQARAFVRSLRLVKDEDWQAFIQGKMSEKGKLPPDIPSNPEVVYRGKGWLNYTDWISDHYQPVVIEHRDFEKAREFVMKLDLKSIHEWEAYRNGDKPDLEPCPEDIPVWPPHSYKDKGWISWSNWFGLKFGKE